MLIFNFANNNRIRNSSQYVRTTCIIYGGINLLGKFQGQSYVEKLAYSSNISNSGKAGTLLWKIIYVDTQKPYWFTWIF